jgi:DNA integrity scanning protein DisA with diadenylate cyclase activity
MKVLDIKQQLYKIEEALKGSKNRISISLKLEASDIALRLMTSKKNFGLFIILGWLDKWNKYTDISDRGQDIFEKHHINLENMAESYKHIASTIDFDGAILIAPDGEVVHSGVIIEGLRPRIIAAKLNPGEFKDLSEQFGFNEKVHARHLAAIASSYVFKKTTVFTISEESDSFHIYEEGKIIYETSK